MARRAVGPRRTGSHSSYVLVTRILAGLSLLLLAGAMTWDLLNDRFWARHTLFASLAASLIVVAVTAAVLNEVLERDRGRSARRRVGSGARHAPACPGDRRDAGERRPP